MPSRYDSPVDPATPNSAHAYALRLVGCNRDVLELGAASGHVTRALVARHCRVTAIEYDADAAAGLDEVAERVLIADLNDPDAFADLAAEFDFVLAGDVLEHLLRPHDVLRRAARLLRPGGGVVVSVPNVAHADVRLSLMQGAWDYRLTGLLDDTHTRFFTQKSIRAMAAEAGLVITDMHRVRVPAFETELPLERDTVPTELLDYVLADPEAETYQFVFAATPDTGDQRLRRLADRKDALERELARALVRHATLEAQLSANQEFIKRVNESVIWRLVQRMRASIFAALGGERSVGAQRVQATLRFIGRLLR